MNEWREAATDMAREDQKEITSLRTRLTESEEKWEAAEAMLGPVKKSLDESIKSIKIDLKRGKQRAEAAEADCAALREALEPFALVGELKNNDYWNKPDHSDYLLYSTIKIIRNKPVEIRVIDTLIAHEAFSQPHPGADLLAKKKAMVEALEFYREKAESVKRYTDKKQLHAIEAIYVELVLDGGAKARAALPGGKEE